MATLVGGGGSGESLPSLSHSGFCAGWCRLSSEVNSPTWGAHRGAHPPRSDSHATAWTGRHPHMHAASACPAGVPVYVCLVRWLVSHCAAVTIAPPSPAHHPFSWRNALCDPGQALESCGPKEAFGIGRCNWTRQGSSVAVGPHAETVKSSGCTRRAIIVVLHFFPHEIQIVYTLNYYLSFTKTYHKSLSWFDQSSMKISLHATNLFQWPFSPLTFYVKDMLLLLGSAAANKYSKDAFLLCIQRSWSIWDVRCMNWGVRVYVCVGGHN